MTNLSNPAPQNPGFGQTIRRFPVMMSFLAVTGCASLGGAVVKDAPKPISAYQTQASFVAPAASWPAADWWASYHDPQLTALIGEAIATAPDLRIAQARIQKADALADQSAAALLPMLDAGGAVSGDRQSYNLGIPVPQGFNDTGKTSLSLNWEVDFWGKNRASLAAATSDAQAAQAEAAAAQLQLSTSIAAAYGDLASLYADQDAATDAIAVRTKTAALLHERFIQGMENIGAVQSAESARDSAQANLAQINEAIGLTKNRIAALIGDGPDRGLALTRPVLPTQVVYGLPSNIPAELIGRRPDVRAARLAAEAAALRIQAAKAAFYPDVNITGLVGFQSLGIGTLLESSSLISSVGPAVSLPIFEGGKLRAQYRGANADYNIAVGQYDAAITQALHDVADVATSERALSIRLIETQDAETEATAAWQVATSRYQNGLANYLDVLSAESDMIAARQATAELRTRSFILNVQLIRALGGSVST